MPATLSTLEKIELMRKKLVVLASKKGISHPEVIRYSQRLDHQLNNYQKLIKRNA